MACYSGAHFYVYNSLFSVLAQQEFVEYNLLPCFAFAAFFNFQ